MINFGDFLVFDTIFCQKFVENLKLTKIIANSRQMAANYWSYHFILLSSIEEMGAMTHHRFNNGISVN